MSDHKINCVQMIFNKTPGYINSIISTWVTYYGMTAVDLMLYPSMDK